MINKFVYLGLGVILVIGIALSLGDYRAWHRAETLKYGQGSPAEVGFAPAENLGLPFAPVLWHFRIKYPVNWQIVNDPLDIAKFIDPSKQAQIIISGQIAQGDLTTEANKLAAGITEDRQYLTVNGTAMTVLTWVGPLQAVQKTVIVYRGKVIVITAICPTSAWKTFAKTFLAVYQSWTPI